MPQPGEQRISAPRAVATTLATLALAALLNADSLARTVERWEHGPGRERALVATETLRSVSQQLYLERPRAWIDARIRPPAEEAPERRRPRRRAPPPRDPEGTVRERIESAAFDRSSRLPPPRAPRRLLTPAEPLSLVVFGDSMLEYLGPELDRRLSATGVVEVTLDWRYSTGLSRPDFFNWPARMEEVVADLEPDAVLVMLGGNDGQNLSLGGRTLQLFSADWHEEYQLRVDETVELLAEDGRALYWMGLPIMRTARQDQKARALNKAYRQATGGRDEVRFLPTRALFTVDGGFSDKLRIDGQLTVVRAGDGVHFTRSGSTVLADQLMAWLDLEWDFERWEQPTPEPLSCVEATPTAAPRAHTRWPPLR